MSDNTSTTSAAATSATSGQSFHKKNSTRFFFVVIRRFLVRAASFSRSGGGAGRAGRHSADAKVVAQGESEAQFDQFGLGDAHAEVRRKKTSFSRSRGVCVRAWPPARAARCL